ncbi:MAG: hypothetical protein JWN37_327 [Candidatus Nomurabacteria bacterium]|nr:hypothetical protein [Candidatus Nomurabacteria bacterium]
MLTWPFVSVPKKQAVPGDQNGFYPFHLLFKNEGGKLHLADTTTISGEIQWKEIQAPVAGEWFPLSSVLRDTPLNSTIDMKVAKWVGSTAHVRLKQISEGAYWRWRFWSLSLLIPASLRIMVYSNDDQYVMVSRAYVK